MPITTDPTTDIGLVRLRIYDTDATSPNFTDEQITAFLTSAGNTWGASAEALEALAVITIVKQKVVKILGMSLDGAKAAEALRLLAKQYRSNESLEDANSGGLFDIAEFIDDSFTAREREYKEIIRNGG